MWIWKKKPDTFGEHHSQLGSFGVTRSRSQCGQCWCQQKVLVQKNMCTKWEGCTMYRSEVTGKVTKSARKWTDRWTSLKQHAYDNLIIGNKKEWKQTTRKLMKQKLLPTYKTHKLTARFKCYTFTESFDVIYQCILLTTL